ncbi:caspase domain-containing protein [Desarmillaria tabescens]|uniref:Caspase domain-containing protein n=1 Tax=Armillaria tabescens TaxID=1929756 RepID=A0AA39NA33_ARMTA|nr:caspase domain-containing protein [Desarmillaria tabescens]KAK0461836.1 caspase domain-containing protein [Desarmillaria tabescens]
MMWDFSDANGPPPPGSPYHQPQPSAYGMPSATYPAAAYGQPGYGEPVAFPSSPYHDPYSAASSYNSAPPPVSSHFLTVPDMNVPPEAPRALSSREEHYHHHYHRSSSSSHHRHHSNPERPARVSHNGSQHIIVSSPRHHHHQSSHSSRPRPASTTPAAQPTQPSQPSQHQCFKYSKCTGRKKALCIGINYRGQPHELKGCINDARHIRDFLMHHWGYKPEDIVMLTDDSTNPRSQPTRKNMLDGMRWLVKNAQPHDSLFFHYSGHGGQTKDQDGDEVDGYDEVIFPVDFKRRGQIIDDEMHSIMVKPLPAGCRLTALFDCCHSGTALDLPYIYGSDGRLKGEQVSKKWRKLKSTSADVISWSGSKDGQTSADTFQGGVAVGAMSYAFITSLRKNPEQSYQQLLRSIRTILHPKYSQKPQLGSSHHIDTNLRFIL